MIIKKLNQAVILAGGRGERLRPLTDTIPKPMAPINGIPFLDYLLYSVIKVGIKKILILLGYKSDVIINRYKNMEDISIEFSTGTEHDMTGRRLLNAYEQLDDYFLLMYGDNYWPIALDEMWFNYIQSGATVSTTVFSNKFGTAEYGFENNVEVGKNKLVLNYNKKRENDGANGVDIGYFIVSKESIDPIINDNISFEEDILIKLIDNKQLVAHVTDIQYYFITNLNSLDNFKSVVLKNNYKPLPKEYFLYE